MVSQESVFILFQVSQILDDSLPSALAKFASLDFVASPPRRLKLGYHILHCVYTVAFWFVRSSNRAQRCCVSSGDHANFFNVILLAYTLLPSTCVQDKSEYDDCFFVIYPFDCSLRHVVDIPMKIAAQR